MTAASPLASGRAALVTVTAQHGAEKNLYKVPFLTRDLCSVTLFGQHEAAGTLFHTLVGSVAFFHHYVNAIRIPVGADIGNINAVFSR